MGLLATAMVLSVILSSCFAISSKTAYAAGFAVSPSSLDLTVEKGSQVQRQLKIYNTAEEDTDFTAVSSNPAAIMISPERGFIESEGAAFVTLTATGTRTGKSEEEVVISFGSRDSYRRGEVDLEVGTAVPVRLKVLKRAETAANALFGIFISASIVVIGIAAYYFAYFARKKPGKLAADFQSAYDFYLTQKRT